MVLPLGCWLALKNYLGNSYCSLGLSKTLSFGDSLTILDPPWETNNFSGLYSHFLSSQYYFAKFVWFLRLYCGLNYFCLLIWTIKEQARFGEMFRFLSSKQLTQNIIKLNTAQSNDYPYFGKHKIKQI